MNVLLPGLSPVTVEVLDKYWCREPSPVEDANGVTPEPVAAIVVAPDTAQSSWNAVPAIPFAHSASIDTTAIPEEETVTVTACTVAKSVADPLDVGSDVVTTVVLGCGNVVQSIMCD